MSKVALVLGGAGNIGSSSAKAFLKEGCCKNIVITSREQGKLDKAIADIKESLGADAAAKVIGIVGSTGKEESAKALKQKVIDAVGDKVDFVVSCMGFAFANMGPLIGVTNDQIQGVFETQFFPGFGGYRAFMPLVKNSGGSYVFVTGGGPDMYLGPGTGVMTIGGSTSMALARVAMKESAADGVCCTEVSFQAGVTPFPEKMPPGYIWLRSADAGKAIVSAATKRKAHVQTLTVTSESDLQQAIVNGIIGVGNANGQA